MACCSYEKERRDLLGSNFPLWCWRMFLCKSVVGVCFLGWDLWLWALDVYVGDWLWWGVDWSVEFLLAGGCHCWQLGRSAEIYCCESGLHREGADPCESVCFVLFFWYILKTGNVMFSQLWAKASHTQSCMSQQILTSLVSHIWTNESFVLHNTVLFTPNHIHIL